MKWCRKKTYYNIDNGQVGYEIISHCMHLGIAYDGKYNQQISHHRHDRNGKIAHVQEHFQLEWYCIKFK